MHQGQNSLGLVPPQDQQDQRGLKNQFPDMSIKAKRPPISPPFNLSKLDLIKSIDRKTIVALREEIFKKVNG